MKKYAFNEITLMQFICISSGVQVGVGLLNLPQLLAQRAGTDGWIGLIIGWIFSTSASLVMVRIMKKYPDGTLLDLLTRYMGKWAGNAGSILFALYFFFYGYVGITRLVLYTNQWLLPQTPPFLVMLLLLIPTYVVARSGLRITGRYAELVFFISLWIPFAYLPPLKDAHWIYLLPVLKEGWKPVFSAFRATFISFGGFGITMMMYPFLTNKQRAYVGVLASNTLTMLIFLSVTIICFVYYSPYEMKEYNEPVVNILKAIEFKFIERIEVLFISFYLFMFSLSWIPTFYLSVFCTSWLFGKQDHRSHFRLLWLLVAVGTCFFMPTFNQSHKMDQFLTWAILGVEYALPVCLLGYLWFYDRLHRGGDPAGALGPQESDK